MLETSSQTEQNPIPPARLVPACQQCGRQDETLRLVAYPYVVSLVFITARQSFRGLWCGKHRAQHLAQAGLLTSTLGWLGIPFGLVYTPIALFQLAGGGIQPADMNIQMLVALAEDKLRKGDTAAAVRCLEEALKFREDPELLKRLNEARPRFGPLTEPLGCLQASLPWIGALGLCALVGTAIGVVDYVIWYLLSFLWPNGLPLLVGLLSWLPLLGGAFVGAMAAKTIVEQVLVRVRSRRLSIAILFALLASLLLTYGIFQGRAIADNTAAWLEGTFTSSGQVVTAWLWTGLAGGIFAIGWLLNRLNYSYQAASLVVVVVVTIFFLQSTVRSARETILWQKRIDPNIRS